MFKIRRTISGAAGFGDAFHQVGAKFDAVGASTANSTGLTQISSKKFFRLLTFASGAAPAAGSVAGVTITITITTAGGFGSGNVLF